MNFMNFDKVKSFLRKLEIHAYKTKLSTFRYINADYGVDLFKVGNKIKRFFASPLFNKIALCILGPILCIGFTGSMMILTVAYPLFSMIWIMISILLILYTFKDETIADKIYRYVRNR